MTADNSNRVAPGNPPKAPRPPRWKRWLRVVLLGLLALLLVAAAVVGVWCFKYYRVVGARPGKLQAAAPAGEFGQWVNPFLGTGGYPWMCGNNSPCAMTPFGMVRLGPETVSMVTGARALNTSGYFYGDDQLLGFSHTRLMGTGATDGGHFLVMPAVKAADPEAWRKGQTVRFSHGDEATSPGYYAVRLREPGVLAELTATPRVGVHRYTFAKGAAAHLHLDISNALGDRRCAEARLHVRADTSEVEGEVRTFGTFASRYGGLKVYFAAQVEPPFAGFRTWGQGGDALGEAAIRDNPSKSRPSGPVGVDLSFGPAQLQVVTLKLAISHASVENARANLRAEAVGKSFEEILAEAREAWETRLSAIRLEGATDRQKRIFYTALYRVFQMPTVFADANGDYLGFDRKVHRAENFRYFTDLSLWDTFRTTHPLYTLIAPQDQRDMMISLVKMKEQGGWLPRWPSGHGYSNSMLGTPADIVIAEAWLKGIRDFDIETAYEAMKQTALAPTPAGAAFSGREGVEQYLKYGYCPSGLMDESVSRTFEFGWADHAIGRLAAALGREADAEQFRKHSQFYRNLWNPGTQHFQPRNAQGAFFEPFKPLLLTYFDTKGKYTRDYVEGSALQWRWAAPYDAEGMIALFKSREYFVEELERFFARSNPSMGRWNPGPYYWHGNQPDIHAAYLFNEAGRPDLTQKWVRWILENKYGDDYVGLDGNDDGGTLSAWYVFSSLGLYPIAGTDRYQLGSPLFARATVDLGSGRHLTVLAENHSPGRYAVEQVWLNEVTLERAWIRHDEIRGGGTLRFRMKDTPGL